MFLSLGRGISSLLCLSSYSPDSQFHSIRLYSREPLQTNITQYSSYSTNSFHFQFPLGFLTCSLTFFISLIVGYFYPSISLCSLNFTHFASIFQFQIIVSQFTHTYIFLFTHILQLHSRSLNTYHNLNLFNFSLLLLALLAIVQTHSNFQSSIYFSLLCFKFLYLYTDKL